MNFEEKTMTMAITNPEVRFEFDYVTEGVMFLMPIDSSGSALVTARECFMKHQRWRDFTDFFRKYYLHAYFYVRGLHEGQTKLFSGDRHQTGDGRAVDDVPFWKFIQGQGFKRSV
jgi:hypothetical protein